GNTLDQPHAFAYLPDLAEAFVSVAGKRTELPVFERLHFEGHTLTGRQLLEACQEAVGRPLKRASLPWPLLRVIAWFNPMMRAVSEMRYLWDTPHSLDGSKLTATIGQVPHTPTVEALCEAIAPFCVGME
ncbi:MAG: hypothetical protein AAFX85_19810, partial [Pseudomonadota bacterium]